MTVCVYEMKKMPEITHPTLTDSNDSAIVPLRRPRTIQVVSTQSAIRVRRCDEIPLQVLDIFVLGYHQLQNSGIPPEEVVC